MMGQLEAVVELVAKRAQQKDLSRWEKARDMLELQEFLRAHGQPHSQRHLAHLTGVARRTIAEQLVIAQVLTPGLLTQSGVAPEALRRTAHASLLRIARMPDPLRSSALRETAACEETGSSMPANPVLDLRDRARARLFERLRDEGGLHVSIVEPMRHLSAQSARIHLEQLLPAVANAIEVILVRERSYYVEVIGNGGVFVYLSPGGAHRRT